MSNTDLVREFVTAWNNRDIEGILSRMTPNARWVNVGLSDVTGHAAIRAIVVSYLGKANTVNWAITHIAEAADGTVLTERNDDFETNGTAIRAPVMGIFEFEGTLISGWRDYFDLPGFQAQMAAAAKQG